MREYKVQIRELLEMTVSVEAESALQARAIVEKGYKNSEYILDAGHYKGVIFRVPVRADRAR